MYNYGAHCALCVYKELVVKQSIHSSNPQETRADKDARQAGQTAAEPQLSSVQKEILDCLGRSQEALTLRQLEGAVSCSAADLCEALDGLTKSSLVSRLNTVIPSYSNRYPGVRVYGE
jgi:hypothetical protein